MHFARSNCGHLKAKWDTHLSCLTCNSCTHISPCYICSSWTEKVWNLAERRRLHATRKSVMTQKRKQKKSKKSKKSQSDMSDNGTVDGSTTPHSFTARGRTHQGGSLADLESDRALSPPVTGHPVTGQPVNQSPVNQSPVTGQLISVHPVADHPVTGQPVTSQPVTSQPGTSQLGSSQPGIGLQSFAYDLQTQIPPGYIPINVPVQSYAPSISSHISHGSVHRLSNVLIPGYERSEKLELPNPASSSRQIIPLEPDFSQVSDPSVMIEPPNSNDLSISRPSRKDQSKREHKSKKRRRHRSSSSSISTSRSDSLSSSRRKKNSKRSKHSHKKRRRRSMTPSSSSNSSQSQLDIGRYTRAHKSPQVVQTPTPIQPEETNFSPITNQPINYDQFQPNLTQQNKESDSETESEVWSFDRAINEVFRLLPPELCPKTQQDQAPLKPLSGIEQLTESRSTPLLVFPQSKLVENTTKYIQNRLDSDKCSRDWICPQSLVSALAPTKFYKSQNQYLPTDNILQLEADASLLDISNKGRASIPLKNLEAWERKARKLAAINSHADLFSSAAFLSLQQESMSVAALSRLLEAVAKSIKHATAMSTLLTTELFQARRDAALASSKLLLDNSTYELRNAPINSKSLFDSRIKEIAKSNFEAQQQRFLASTSIQSQSHSYKPPSQSRAFKIPKYPAKQTTSRPKPTQSYRSKNIPQSSSSHTKKDNIKRTGNIRQFPSSKPASSSARL